jgi:hypothetical protein
MKAVSISIVLLLAIAGASLQQTLPSCSLSDNTNKNLFALKWLNSKGISINPTPTVLNDTTICGGEWATQMSCCDLTTTRNFINTQNDMISGKWKNYIAKLGRVRGKLLAGIKKLVTKLSVTDLNNRMNMITKISTLASRFSPVKQMLPNSAIELDMLKAWVDQFETNIQTFKTQGKVCFEAMKKTRASMFCAICSGKAQTYTEAQTATSLTFKITTSGCQSIVNACYPVWKFNFGLTSIIQSINTIKNAKNPSDSTTVQFRNDVTLSDFEVSTLRDTFSACNLANTTLNCGNSTTLVDEHYKRLCRNSLFVNQDNSVTEGDEATINDMGDADADNASNDATTPVSSRLLQQAQTTDPRVGVSIDDANGYVNATLDSGMNPGGSIESSTAGDFVSSFTTLIRTSVVVILVSFGLN